MFRQRPAGVTGLGTSGLRRLYTALTGFCLVQMLTGCISVDRPDLGLRIPDAYQTTYHAPRAATPPLDWWRSFHSTELTGLVEQAQTANFDIAAAVARITQADAQSKVAGAALLPNVAFDGSATRTRSSQANGNGNGNGGFSGSESVSYRLALNASYELDFWGKNRALVRAAQENSVAARFDRDTVAVSTVVSVATAYFQVLSSQDRSRIARENLAASTRILNLIKQRREAGTASDLEVSQQESLVGTVRAAIPQFDQTLRQNKAVLALLVGRAPSYLKVRGGSLYRLAIPHPSTGLPSELLFQRPDIRFAEASLAAADANVEAARAAMFPSITLTGQYGLVSNALKNLFTPQAIFYQVASDLTQPVFDGFHLEGLLEQSKGRQIELLENYRKSIISGFSDVEQALIAIADTTERERIQEEVVRASRQAFQIVESRLQQGTVDMVTVLQTEQTLFTAEDNRVVARLDRLQAVLSLYQALGGAWLPPPPKSRAPTGPAIKPQ